MYNTPLFDALKQYQKLGYSPFFMPGHKLGEGIPSAFQLDLTELEETDNLHIPSSVIKQAQALLAAAFGAKDSFFLVNGSTSGIQALFLCAFKPGDKVIIPRDCHVSCISAIMLTGIVPVFIEPEFIPSLGLYGGVSPQKIQQAVNEHPDAKAVYLTSPTYYGFCSDLSQICLIAHQNNMIVLVDEAHGAHFQFHDKLPKTALSQGADLCVQSAHKTLPALTQGAYLHSSGTIGRQMIQNALDLLLTSSPSYLLMAYLDIARAVMEKDGKAIWDEIICRCQSLPLDHLRTAKDFKGSYAISDTDPSRITVFGDFSSFPFADYKIAPEMANQTCAVFLPSAGNGQKDYGALEQLLSDLSDTNIRSFSPPPRSQAVKPLRESFFSEKDTVPLTDSIGRICGSVIAPYPPGIPVLLPGELITKETVQYLQQTKSPLFGIHETITVLK